MRKACIALLMVCALIAPCAANATEVICHDFFHVSQEAFTNPYIGHVVWADSSPDDIEQPFTMVYVGVTWAELEPQKGEYAFDAMEKLYQFALWRERGVHAVFRLVLDKPGKQSHMDIPEWLAQETGGEAYDCEYGKGYCPDYANEGFIAAHARLLAALGERYDDDPFIAFIQLGSIGHWGEWHIHKDAGVMPVAAVRARYAEHYVSAFPNTFLMMRRPFREAAANGMGLFNDVAGYQSGTERWLGWIEAGGEYPEAGENDALVAMPDAWRTAPIGGELNQTITLKKMLTSSYDQTEELFLRSHASWIGPHCFADIDAGGAQQQALDKLMTQLGYRLRVEELMALRSGDRASLVLTWYNEGCAPFYFDWPCVLVYQSPAGQRQTYALPMDVRTLMPGQPQDVLIELDASLFDAQGASLYVAVLDPATGKPGLRLAMDEPMLDGMVLVWEK